MNKYLVARSYQNLQQVGDEYTVNGKTYIKVYTKTGILKQVRTYTEKEYNKYYPPVQIIQPAKSRRDVLGFGEAGYIWLFKGNTPDAIFSNIDWFRASPCRYARTWGWYLPSDIEMPDPLPVDITPIKLMWEQISVDDQLKKEEEIEEFVNSLIYDESPSEFIGEIGDRIDVELTCDKAMPIMNNYGTNYFHTFHDDCGNVYVWSTTARLLDVNTVYHIRGTVKEHSIYKNVKQTILSRCKCEEVE